MYKIKRENEILDILKKEGFETVESLSRNMHVSTSSIRRDLRVMESKGLVIRTHGGVEISETQNRILPFSARYSKNTNEKRKIAAKAVSLIREGDVLFLDASSSTYFFADALKSFKDITIITDSVDVLFLMTSCGLKTYSTGGKMSSENRSCLVGSEAEGYISQIHAKWCIFSVQGVSNDLKLYDCIPEEIGVRKKMFECSEHKIFLCDSSKINHQSTFYQCDMSEVDYVVSDFDFKKNIENLPEKTEFFCV